MELLAGEPQPVDVPRDDGSTQRIFRCPDLPGRGLQPVRTARGAVRSRRHARRAVGVAPDVQSSRGRSWTGSRCRTRCRRSRCTTTRRRCGRPRASSGSTRSGDELPARRPLGSRRVLRARLAAADPADLRRRGLARGPRARGRRRQPLRRLRRAARRAEPTTGVVILPDVRGLYRFYEELALRFAERGHRRDRVRLLRPHGRRRRSATTTSSTWTHVDADDARGRSRPTSRAAVAWLREQRRDVGLHGRLLLRRPQLVALRRRRARPRGRGRLLRQPGRPRRLAGPIDRAGRDGGADPRAAGRRRPEHHRRATTPPSTRR